eukprot:scaffold431_cov334-Pavlova_lutheri.AAC.25
MESRGSGALLAAPTGECRAWLSAEPSSCLFWFQRTDGNGVSFPPGSFPSTEDACAIRARLPCLVVSS